MTLTLTSSIDSKCPGAAECKLKEEFVQAANGSEGRWSIRCGNVPGTAGDEPESDALGGLGDLDALD
jgi:hypothetical protein